MTCANHDNTAAVRRVLVDELRANQRAPLAGLEVVSDDVLLGTGGLGISSLLLLHIFVKLESTFRFTFEDAAVAAAKFVTVGDLVRFVGEAVACHSTTGVESK